MTKQDRIQPRKLKGFRDLLPVQATLKKEITDRIWQNALLAGFQAIETPVLEYAETLLGTGGTDTDKEVYRFMDHGDRMVALRFDLTVPFARYVAENYSDLVFPFKKVQIGHSWRGEKPQKGRYREFCQADLDIVGVDSLAADAEVLSCILKNLDEIIHRPFTMAIGNRIILSALIRSYLPKLEEGGEAKALIALDKLAKIGRQAVVDLLLALPGVASGEADALLAAIEKKTAGGDSDLGQLQSRFAAQPELLGELQRLEDTVAILRELLGANAQGKVKIDLSIARGLGYYTGIVFETTIDGLDGFGSISSGGRYNGLVSRFSSIELPGIGGSIGVDRLLAALEQLEGTKAEGRKGVFIALAGVEGRIYGFRLLGELREKGWLADIALKEGKLGNQFKFADKRSYAWVITIGAEELATGTVSLKNLQSGEEHKAVPRQNVLDRLR